jgi:flavoprotein
MRRVVIAVVASLMVALHVFLFRDVVGSIYALRTDIQDTIKDLKTTPVQMKCPQCSTCPDCPTCPDEEVEKWRNLVSMSKVHPS